VFRPRRRWLHQTAFVWTKSCGTIKSNGTWRSISRSQRHGASRMR
jgi:hypothetical protein